VLLVAAGSSVTNTLQLLLLRANELLHLLTNVGVLYLLHAIEFLIPLQAFCPWQLVILC
jgi:hypothetical protein